MTSGRVSIESSRSQQVTMNSTRTALGTAGPRHQNTVLPSMLSRNKLPSRSEEMKQRIQKLEAALEERDHLVFLTIFEILWLRLKVFDVKVPVCILLCKKWRVSFKLFIFR